MRALSNEIEFVEFLKMYDNEAPQFPQFGESIIEIPQQLIGDKNNLILSYLLLYYIINMWSKKLWTPFYENCVDRGVWNLAQL